MKKIVSLIAVAVALSVITTPVFANSQGHKKGLEQKFYHKAYFFGSHAEELGLSDDQVKSIWAMKRDTKKYLIRQQAEIDVLRVDIKGHLHEQKIDQAVISELIDKKYDLKKEKAKRLVKGIADLKGMLSDEQYAKAKAIWKSNK